MDLLAFFGKQLYVFVVICIASQILFPNNYLFRVLTYLMMGMGLADGWVIGIENLWADTVMPLMGQPVSTYKGVTQWQFLLPIGLGLLSYLMLFPKYFWITRLTMALGIGMGMGAGLGRNIATLIVELARMATIRDIIGAFGIVTFISTFVLSYYFIFLRPPKTGTLLMAHNSIRRTGYYVLLLTFAIAYAGWISVSFEGPQKLVLWFKDYFANGLYLNLLQ